ncbi:DUF4238 domain-containing protein [Pseudoalteromonas sp. NSLLW218]|uniref:DUF4238 domain-containing protein n=1 Tax=Pseudoalteromonas sp. NSLLW218 TaxID=2792048 RepID=UPI0018CE424D|nr:DUF4238 domain-containing protein [Pseudoalteromonas sp. NSLLW218]MBH0089141.1 DUF4238 domain-containing protein [Pseudoalteromonas sp. NSLLW218]
MNKSEQYMDWLNNKKLEVKQKHHYIWANYMKHWSTNGRDIYYTKKKGGVALDSIKSVAMEKYFYRVNTLTEKHVYLIEKLIAMSNDMELKKHHEKVLKSYLDTQKMYKYYTSLDIESEYGDKLFNAAKNNSIEDRHSQLERDALSVSNKLRNLDVNTLKNIDQMTDFLLFLGHQLTRTKAFKETFIKSFAKNCDPQIAELMEESWWFISFLYGTNLGKSLCINRSYCYQSILENNTSIPFITADAPVVNIHPRLDMDTSPLKHETEYFYPLSPTKAYFIGWSDRFVNSTSLVNESFVKEVNKKMAEGAHFHIISNKAEVLKLYKR